MSFAFFGFQKVDLDVFDFNLDTDDGFELDVSIDPVWVDPVPEPSASPSFGGVFLEFGGFIYDSGTLNGSLSAGVSDTGATYSETTFDDFGFWF